MAIKLKRELFYKVEISYLSKDEDGSGSEKIVKLRDEKTLEDATAFIKKYRDDVQSDSLKSWFTAKLEIGDEMTFLQMVYPYELDETKLKISI